MSVVMSSDRSGTNTGTKRGEVVVDQVNCEFGGLRVLHQADLIVRAGEFFTLLGPSGSGKSTLLRIIAGLIELESGTVSIDGIDVTRQPTQQRDLGFVFQNYALFPHLTVAQNIEFGLRIRKVRGELLSKRVNEMLELVELGAMADRYPAQLSGGQQQRVALGRALAQRPRVLLLDEPLGALDRRLRQDLGSEIRRVQREADTTAIYVTHDQEEAYILSDRMGVMESGYIRQLGTPDEVYGSPCDSFVANFLGETNAFSCTVLGHGDGLSTVRVNGFVFPARLQDSISVDSGCTLSVRPENIRLSTSALDAPAGYHPVAEVRVVEARFFGQTVRVRLSDEYGKYIVDLDNETQLPQPGDSVVMCAKAGAGVLLPKI